MASGCTNMYSRVTPTCATMANKRIPSDGAAGNAKATMRMTRESPEQTETRAASEQDTAAADKADPPRMSQAASCDESSCDHASTGSNTSLYDCDVDPPDEDHAQQQQADSMVDELEDGPSGDERDSVESSPGEPRTEEEKAPVAVPKNDLDAAEPMDEGTESTVAENSAKGSWKASSWFGKRSGGKAAPDISADNDGDSKEGENSTEETEPEIKEQNQDSVAGKPPQTNSKRLASSWFGRGAGAKADGVVDDKAQKASPDTTDVGVGEKVSTITEDDEQQKHSSKASWLDRWRTTRSMSKDSNEPQDPPSELEKGMSDLTADDQGVTESQHFIVASPSQDQTEESLELASQSMALNDAFMALESMRKANLDLELAKMGTVDHRFCTQCLREQYEKEELRAAEGKERRTWKHVFKRRRTAPPCLVCASPVCQNHASSEFRKDKVTICSDCAPLFGVDFIFDLVFCDDKAHRSACVDKIVDSYDRAVLIIKYSCQYIDDIAKSLRENTERDNNVALGSSSIGLVSGITGAAAAAVHIAAAAAAGAAILSPAGPPLFIASLVFGGTAAACSTGTEAVSYYSEPNQMANRIMALHELINSLLQVTVVLKEALVNGRINLDHYVDKKNKGKEKVMSITESEIEEDEETTENVDMTKNLASSVDNDTWSVTTAQTDLIDAINDTEQEGDFEVQASIQNIALNDVASAEEMDGDILVESAKAESPPTTQTDLLKRAVNKEKSDKPTASSSSLSKSKNPASKEETSTIITSKHENMKRTICRTTTNVMKAASAASAACGVLSVTTIILEAKNMTDSLERMKTNKCEKADILLAIKAEVDRLPDTSMIASECESYLKGSADEAQPAKLTMRERNMPEKDGSKLEAST